MCVADPQFVTYSGQVMLYSRLATHQGSNTDRGNGTLDTGRRPSIVMAESSKELANAPPYMVVQGLDQSL
jgi:hypothetical protein